MSQEVTAGDIRVMLDDIAVASGDRLIVHSSLRSVGAIEGGPDTLLAGLLERLGRSGTLVMPAFNYTRPLPDPWYDPSQTPGRTGTLTEMARAHPGSLRSLHPTHSVTAIGPDASDIIEGHLRVRAFGVGSPIDKLAARGGKILLIGVDQRSNSTIHVGEEHAGTPKASWYERLPSVRVRLPDGKVIVHRTDDSASCSSAFNAIEGPLRQRRAILDSRLGNSAIQLMEGSQVINAVVEVVSASPNALRCTWTRCRPCVLGRSILPTGRPLVSD